MYTLAHPSDANPSGFVSPTRRRLPFVPYSPSQAWKLQLGRSQPLHSKISFDYSGQSRQGVSMRDLRVNRDFIARLHGASDPVLQYPGLQKIVFRIQVSSSIVRFVRPVAGLTRMALAVQIASNFAHFFEAPVYETATASDWMISPNCVRFEHLYLISLQNTFEDIWQADIALDLP
ncbi:hypothetical protein B0H15DRAFT_776758 [Mycena belliarum]|uniref:Uncharacterized protein n=1 Tax=Mycena belliarum TaxID=1033014 RepID=A0AAD6U770_9AGAR|nr:hypothetical protein B0H15DRAFT_776758 [Mycena belliae]